MFISYSVIFAGKAAMGPGGIVNFLPFRSMLFGAAVVVACAAAGGVLAGNAGVSHDRAREAVQSGEIMPLHRILAIVSEKYEGRVLEVLLRDREEGLYGWVYDIHLFTPRDNVLVLRVDAGTATILKIEGSDVEESRVKP